MIRRSAPFALVALAACGASHPSADPSATSFSAERAPAGPDAAVAATVADAGPADIDVSTAVGVGIFFAALCGQAARGDDAWLDLHLSAKIRSSVVAQRTNDQTTLVALGHEGAGARAKLLADDGTGAALCRPSGPTSLDAFEASSYYATGLARGKVDTYRFVIDYANGHPQLAEYALQLPLHPLPIAAKKRPFAIESSAIDPWTEKATSADLTMLVDGVRAEPHCLYEEAARAPSSPIVIVDATKTEGTSALVHVYPTASPVSASLLACLETQLGAMANAKLGSRSVAVEGVVHIFLDPKTIPAKGFSFSGTKTP